MRSSSDWQVVLSQNGQIKEPEVPELFSILTDSWRLSSILIFLQTIPQIILKDRFLVNKVLLQVVQQL